nr:MAG TPA: tail collar domain protein [Caudoviricetes sp.]
MEDQEFINQLAEKLSKLGTVRPLGFHYLHPYGTVPADSIICNGATYSRALYKDFFDYITTQGWVKTEAEWQEIAERDNGSCPFYSEGDGSTNFRTPKFAPYQQIAVASVNAGTYHQVGLPNITGRSDLGDIYSSISFSGAIATASNEGDATGATRVNAGGNQKVKLTFNASNSNSIYGRSDTVQPESHEWVMCVVAYGVATNVGAVDIQNVMSAVNAVQASITEVEGKITKFAAPAYASGSKITANTTVTIQSNGFLRYFIWLAGTGGKTQYITINGTKLAISADNFSTDRGILPVMKGDTVNSSADECMFYPARYGV